MSKAKQSQEPVVVTQEVPQSKTLEEEPASEVVSKVPPIPDPFAFNDYGTQYHNFAGAVRGF